MLPTEICPKNPEKEEKITIKEVVAEAFFGSNPSQTSAGTIKFPPPTPKSPPIYPAKAPTPTP
jgi:hypothetical protein